MGINWGVPVQRKKKEEKFKTPVVTMSAFAGKGSGRKLTFNQAAVDSLGLVKPEDGNESFVTFGKDTDTGDIVLMSSLEDKPEMKFFRVNKSFSFSDKRTYEFIANSLGLETSVENYLHFDKVEGESYFKVFHTNPNTTEEESNDVVETVANDFAGKNDFAGNQEYHEIKTEEELNIPIVEEEEEPVILEPVTNDTETEETVTDEW